MRPDTLAAAGTPSGALMSATLMQETVSGLNAVVMLGSFMHAAPTAEHTAELAAGGLAAVTRLPLAAVAWYAEGPDGPLTVAGRCAGEPGISAQVATTLRRLGPQLNVFRPSRRDGDDMPRALRRNGVESLLALPLRVSTESLGFLLVGGRRDAIPEDLTLVQALGAQTSTALYVARIRESEERRVRELGDLAAELRTQGELLARALHLQEELIALVLRGKDARTIVEHLAERLGAPVWLLDAERRAIAHASGGPEQAAAPLRESELDRVLGGNHPDHDPRSVEVATAAGVARFLVQSVATDREIFGYLMVGSTALGPVDRTTFQGGRLVLALRLLIERSVAEAEERLGRDLIQDAMLRSGDGATRAGLAVRLGYEDDGPAVVLVMRVEPGGTTATERGRRRGFALLREELRGSSRGLAGMIGSDIVAVMRPATVHGCAKRFLERVTAAVPGMDVAVGLSDVRPGLGELEPAFREAQVAVTMAQRCPARLLRFADLGLHRILFDVGHVDRVDDHIERWIGPLLRYDADNRARLVETLGCFLSGDGHQGTAKRLAIHPSTLKYRLGRIREVLGVDFAHPEVRFNIELALRLADGLRTLEET
ncbi:PucR family transcriptional regulator [Pseudonocardia sp. GCM10023141]|uniref:PucR family transcriptional regulator n=1 Tax=Pseudonocardia sp. GCM10023141 TaxID=3252653 RepID=UPI0036239E16